MILGVLLAASFLILCWKTIGLKKVLGLHIVVDVLFTLGVAAAFSDTLGGLTAAIAGGLMLSIVLWCLRKLMPYEVPRLDRARKRIVWLHIDPRRR